MARTLNGNLTGRAAHATSDDFSRPTDAVLNFIKANTDGDEYRRRFDEIYSTWRHTDYKRYESELRAWRQEIADAQASRHMRGDVVRLDRGRGTDSLPARGEQ